MSGPVPFAVDLARDITELERRIARLPSLSPAKDEALAQLLLALQRARHFLDDEVVAAMTHRWRA